MAEYISKDELVRYLEPLTNTPAILIKRYVENMPTVDIQNSQELIYKKACGVDVEASIEAQKSWEQWRDNVKAIQESNLLETEVEGLFLNFEQRRTMTDKEYEFRLKDLECCQNCIHFSLGMHFDGCGEGWCHCGEWTIHPRADVCDKYKRRIEQGG